MNNKKVEAVVIGTSSGGMEALSVILAALPEDFAVPLIIVQHLGPRSDGYLAAHLNALSPLMVKEADEKEKALPGYVYLAPPNYHLLVEKDGTLSLSVEAKVNYARPSIDVLFETAAEAYREKLIGVILTGANRDGSLGLKRIKEWGGLAIVQDPETAWVDSMPKAAITLVKADYILPAEEIACKLLELAGIKQ